jgi:transposase-like protein
MFDVEVLILLLGERLRTSTFMSKFYDSSRRTTPWSEEDNATALQSFIDQINQDNYYTKHPPLNSYYEIELLNSIKINKCKYCECNELQKFGFTKNGIRRYRCKKCGKTFSITNNTIFDNHKIPISEWLDFCLALFRGQSFTSISKNNRNSYNTTKYWINKIFLLLKNYQNDIILKHKVLIDETYYRVIKRDIVKVDNKMKRGLSENQICIGIGCDENRFYCHIEGYGKPSMNKTLDTFINHIEKESELIHDDEKSHNKLVEKLSLKSTSFRVCSQIVGSCKNI